MSQNIDILVSVKVIQTNSKAIMFLGSRPTFEINPKLVCLVSAQCVASDIGDIVTTQLGMTLDILTVFTTRTT